jgi:hypothetical protein
VDGLAPPFVLSCGSTFEDNLNYSVSMTKLLEQAFETVRGLPSDSQDEIARAILSLAGDEPHAFPLSAEERAAIEHSKAAAARGEFASDDQVRAVWSKHDL